MKNRKCPTCGGEAIKDYYKELWICVSPDCKRCDLLPEDFQ